MVAVVLGARYTRDDALSTTPVCLSVWRVEWMDGWVDGWMAVCQNVSLFFSCKCDWYLPGAIPPISLESPPLIRPKIGCFDIIRLLPPAPRRRRRGLYVRLFRLTCYSWLPFYPWLPVVHGYSCPATKRRKWQKRRPRRQSGRAERAEG